MTTSEIVDGARTLPDEAHQDRAFGVPDRDFPDGCAVVFGGSGDLGGESAGLMAARGSDVVLTSRSRHERATDVVDRVRGMGRKASTLPCDVRDETMVQSIVEAALSEHGRIHTIVFATGPFFEVTPVADIDPAAFREVMEADIFGFLNVAKAGVPALRADGGAITALIAPTIDLILPGNGTGSTAKTAIAHMIEHIAAEEAANGIRANSVGPGIVDSSFVDRMMGTRAGEYYAQADQMTPLGRPGRAAEIAEAVAFLSSSRASYITGQHLMVDGGLSL